MEKISEYKVTGSYQNEEEAQKITYFEIKGIKIALYFELLNVLLHKNKNNF